MIEDTWTNGCNHAKGFTKGFDCSQTWVLLTLHDQGAEGGIYSYLRLKAGVEYVLALQKGFLIQHPKSTRHKRPSYA
nr:hypothetical protein CFP56_19389 [Quercus suber]